MLYVKVDEVSVMNVKNTLLIPLAIAFYSYSTGLAAQQSVVDFDNPTPPGASTSLLENVFSDIDWGVSQWRWEGPLLIRLPTFSPQWDA